MRSSSRWMADVGRDERRKGDAWSMKKQQQRGTAAAKTSKAKKRSPKELLAAVTEAATPRTDEPAGSAEQVARFSAARDQVKKIHILLTLQEACLLIGESVEPDSFAQSAFSALAEELDAVALIDGSNTDIDISLPLKSIAERARLASRIERQLSR